jgi:predicted  nucleic acid-binding Zn-ribbon protein
MSDGQTIIINGGNRAGIFLGAEEERLRKLLYKQSEDLKRSKREEDGLRSRLHSKQHDVVYWKTKQEELSRELQLLGERKKRTDRELRKLRKSIREIPFLKARLGIWQG